MASSVLEVSVERRELPAGRNPYLREFMHRPTTLAAAAFVVLLLLTALIGPALLDRDPNAIAPAVMQHPSPSHLLGTDSLGRDVLVYLVYGTRISLEVGFLAALSATGVGIVVGALAGYLWEWADTALMRVAEMFQVMPTFVLAAVIVAIAGSGTTQVIVVIALLAWPQTARVMRAEVLRVRELPFVDAARCLGVREHRLLIGEVSPNALAPVIPTGALVVAQAILLQAGLAFLGLGRADQVSWGAMLNVGQKFLTEAWWLSVFPGAAIFLTVIAFNLLADGLGRVLNPRLRGAER